MSSMDFLLALSLKNLRGAGQYQTVITLTRKPRPSGGRFHKSLLKSNSSSKMRLL